MCGYQRTPTHTTWGCVNSQKMNHAQLIAFGCLPEWAADWWGNSLQNWSRLHWRGRRGSQKTWPPPLYRYDRLRKPAYSKIDRLNDDYLSWVLIYDIIHDTPVYVCFKGPFGLCLNSFLSGPHQHFFNFVNMESTSNNINMYTMVSELFHKPEVKTFFYDR